MKKETQANETETTLSAVAAMASTIVDTSRDINNILASGNVKRLVRTHYIDTANDIAGIEQLIESILRANGAIHPDGAEHTAMRNVVLASAMLYAEIETAVRKAFGPDRYVDTSTIYVYLNGKGTAFRSVQMTGTEDKGRTSCKPRSRYYLSE